MPDSLHIYLTKRKKEFFKGYSLSKEQELDMYFKFLQEELHIHQYILKKLWQHGIIKSLAIDSIVDFMDDLDNGKFSVAYRYKNLLEMSPLSYADEIDAWYKCNHVAIFNGEKHGARREVLLTIR